MIKVLVLFALLIALQVFLSTRKIAWFGLILPILNILYSLLMLLQVAVFGVFSVLDVFVQMMTAFIICNIPTLILVFIYAACRHHMQKERDLHKMQVEDLE